MSLLDYFKISKESTASLAKERLRKYINVGQDAISVSFEQDEDQETLELNIVLPDLQLKNT